MGSRRDISYLGAYRYGSLVIWPPDEVRNAVNELRRRFDPASDAVCEAHITLTWPFLEQPDTWHWHRISQVTGSVEPFRVKCGPLNSFLPYPCVFLQIEPAETVRQLHIALHNTKLFDDRSPLTREHFVPHMSITDGYPDREQSRMILNGLQGFEPQGTFECREITWIVPNINNVFEVSRTVSLG